MAMLQASNWPTMWGPLGMRRLIGRYYINLVEDSRSWWRCWRSLSAEELIWTELRCFHALRIMRFIE